MKKAIALVMAMVMVFALCACGQAAAPAASAPAAEAPAAEAPAAEAPAAEEKVETVTYRCGTNHAEDFCTSVALAYWSDLVYERTNGRIKIDIYYNAVLGEEKAAIEQCQYGGMEFARVNISPMSEFVNDFNALCMPFIYKDSEHFYKVLEGMGMDMMHSDEMKNAGFYGLTWYDGGFRNFYTTKEVRTPADMAGMNIRVQESSLMIGMIEALGATAVAIPFADVYSALQTGVADGAENSIVQWLAMSHYEVAPYLVIDEHTSAPDMLIMSEQVRQSMSEEDVAIIEQAAYDSWLYQRELWAAADAEAADAVTAAGGTIIEITPEEKQQFADCCTTLWQAYEDGKYYPIIEEILALA